MTTAKHRLAVLQLGFTIGRGLVVMNIADTVWLHTVLSLGQTGSDLTHAIMNLKAFAVVATSKNRVDGIEKHLWSRRDFHDLQKSTSGHFASVKRVHCVITWRLMPMRQVGISKKLYVAKNDPLWTCYLIFRKNKMGRFAPARRCS